MRMKKTIWKSLVEAENLVEAIGDPYWFKEVYTRSREYHGILESITIALEAQGLLQEYNTINGT